MRFDVTREFGPDLGQIAHVVAVADQPVGVAKRSFDDAIGAALTVDDQIAGLGTHGVGLPCVARERQRLGALRRRGQLRQRRAAVAIDVQKVRVDLVAPHQTEAAVAQPYRAGRGVHEGAQPVSLQGEAGRVIGALGQGAMFIGDIAEPQNSGLKSTRPILRELALDREVAAIIGGEDAVEFTAEFAQQRPHRQAATGDRARRTRQRYRRACRPCSPAGGGAARAPAEGAAAPVHRSHMK